MQQFAALSGLDKEKVNEIYTTNPGFEHYERGMINDSDFRNFVRDVFSVKCADEQIDGCWNAMLLGLPLKKLSLIERLKEDFSVYLLSNTNNIHLNYINQIMLPGIADNGNALDSYFHRAYYSHIMKKRKPNSDIFEQVLSENSLKASETLFLDDNLSNIEGAKKLGIQTVHVITPDLILDYFHEK
jgi:putative hydrolase of the HAD superfamily